MVGQTYLSKSILVVMKNINLESNSSSMVNISHEILFVLRCLAYFWNSATLRELSKCILYQIHTEFFLIVEFSGPPNLAGQKDLLKTGESSNLPGHDCILGHQAGVSEQLSQTQIDTLAQDSTILEGAICASKKSVL